MFKSLTKEMFQVQAAKARQSHSRVLIFQQFPGDLVSPIIAHHVLAGSAQSCLFEIHQPEEQIHGTFLGIHPCQTYRSFDRNLLDSVCAEDGIFPPFFGGPIGFLAFDVFHGKGDEGVQFDLYQSMLVFDHLSNVLTIAEAVEPNPEHYAPAMQRIGDTYAKICGVLMPSSGVSPLAPDLQALTDDAAFSAMIVQGQEAMQEGKLFKIVLSRSFTQAYSGTPLALYRASRMVNPSPYHFLFQTKDFAFVGASPEKLLSVKGDSLEMAPITGTVPRGAGKEEALLLDPKEGSDHVIAVDMACNDLAAVAKPGSLRVVQFKRLVHFAHVSHQISHIEGKLSDSQTSIEALKAVFPAGTLVGGPKRDAIAFIRNCEHAPRGVYGGAVCTLDHRGNLYSCLLIRSAVLQGGMATLRTGAGIVLDSDPKSEAEETRHKTKGMRASLALAITL
ncbi:MAG: anthranilate synthase component I family protein [Parachlamydia sp.]|nr:anthranilate synthase component I family protein [Parachlamydia sp.]